MPNDACPTPETLQSFNAGTLADDSFEAVATHLETCAACLRVLQNSSVTDDPLMAALHSPVAEDTFALEPQCQNHLPTTFVELCNSPEFTLDPAANASSTPERLQTTVAETAPAPTGKPVEAAGEDSASVPPTEAYASGPAGKPADRVLPRIPKYHLVRWLGGGGMGDVFEAVNVLGRRIALKVVRPDRTDAEFNNRFRREAATLHDLNHPNVIRIYEYDEPGGTPFFTMRLLTGGTLADCIADYQSDRRKAVALVATVAEAVGYLHRRGILHRDLKPMNIMFDEGNQPCVTDFGLTKSVKVPDVTTAVAGPTVKCADAGTARADDPAGQLALTVHGRVMGTVLYMAPEQVQGEHERVGPQVDVWALGTILYELLAGNRPFDGKESQEVRQKILTAQPQSLASVRPRLSRDLKTIVETCLEKDPKDRYATAAELADDLGRWQRGEPILARPAGLMRKSLRLVRRHRLAAGAIVLALFAIAAVLVRSHFTDPDRPMKAAQKKVHDGKTVEFIGEKGAPAWFRVRAGDEKTKAVADRDGDFTVDSLALALIELLPDTKRDHFQFTASVRHNEGFGESSVGIYFGHAQQFTGGDWQHTFCELSFADCGLLANARPDPNSPVHEKRSKVILQLRHFSEGLATQVRNYKTPSGLGKFFTSPQGPAECPWRKLTVDISPTLWRVKWEDEDWLQVWRADVGNRIDSLLSISTDQLDDFHPDFGPRGGIGLYVFRGSASFRFVNVAPLDE
jgi:serine/threonine-protein kinase